MKKGILIITIIVITLITIAIACQRLNNNMIQLGTSKLYIELPEGYKETDDDFDEDQVAYYYKDDNSIDFDIYQWNKEDKYTLEKEVNFFSSQYNSTPSSININGISGFKYITEEVYDNNKYTVINYMFEDNESIVEISFWTINTDKELKDVENIINTLTIK